MTRDVDDLKRAVRADIRERRQLLSDRQREKAADGLTAQLDALVADIGARTVSCYLSTPYEPGTRHFVAGAVARGIRVLLPITRADGLLDWAVATDELEIADGLLGLPEPVGELLGPIAVDDADLMLVPAAAVDHSGTRLGWGRGFFDKTIGSMSRQPPIYAVVFDTEVVESLPRELHDQPVGGVVTPARTVSLPL